MKYKIFKIETYDKIEQLGTKEKFWFYTKKDLLIKLFKIGRPGTGENWAEKATFEIAKLLKIPCASYDFAIWKNTPGVLSPSFVPEFCRLIHGNELLLNFISPNYPIDQRYKVTEYKLSSVESFLINLSNIVNLPIGYAQNDKIRFPIDIFISYIMFDCLIANPDRHHENWGILLDSKHQKYYLAPTYDHASGLGCRVSDKERKNRLTTKDKRYSVKAFVRKPKTPFYDRKSKGIKTIDAFKMLIKKNEVAADYWLNQLYLLSDDAIKNIFDKIPEDLISSAAIDFAIAIIKENKKRLLAIKEG